MKLLKIQCLLVILAFIACESPDMGETINDSDGLLSFVIVDPNTNIEYRSNVSGPYNDGDTIYIRIPSPVGNPADITKLKAYCSIQNNCRIEPPLQQGLIDFTEPYPITVINGQGIAKTNYVKVVLIIPSAAFTKPWSRFDVSWWAPGWIPSIESVGDYLLVYDNVDFDGQPIKVFDRFTGELIKTIPVPNTVTRQICADDAGHFVVTRFNNHGAGFVVYYYDNIDSSPVEILNWADGQSPANMGFKASAVGNLKTGKGYIYATIGIHYWSQSANINTNVYYWEFNDGVPVNTEPTVLPSGIPTWSWCSVQKQSVDINSDLFCTFHIYQPDQGSQIVIQSTTGNVVAMNKSNHLYRIFDQKAFRIGNAEFLAISQQGYEDDAPLSLKVFDITNRENLGMTPESENYENFMLFQSEDFPIWNVTREGDVAVSVDGDEAYIYLLVTSSNPGTAGVVAYKMTME
jgi:hypothetical protein